MLSFKTCLLVNALILLAAGGGEKTDPKADQAAFTQASAGIWQEVFSDPGTERWQKKWFLDGEIGTVSCGPKGMTLTAGPIFKNDAHHLVLWTKQSFKGDLKIDYEYTRTDDETRCVTILYIQATGSGKAPYLADISTWNDLRKVPSMKTYFNHMNTYHLSYAAFPNYGKNRTPYLRGRRYLPESKKLAGSELTPDYLPKGLFAPGVKHRITIIKRKRNLYLRIRNPERVSYFHFRNPDHPVVTEGRIGLRHMFTRSARYRNFQISVAGPDQPDDNQ